MYKRQFQFKTENSGILNSILSEIEDPESTTIVLFFSVLVLAGFGLYRRGQNKVKAQMFAAMVEPTAMESNEDDELVVADMDDEDQSDDEFDDIELELIDIESIEDES